MSILKLRNLSAIRSATNGSRVGVSSRWFSKLAEGIDITSPESSELGRRRFLQFLHHTIVRYLQGEESRHLWTPSYTGVCSQQHVPSYKSHIDKFKAKGIDSVICVSVNDPYAINGWADKLNAKDAVKVHRFF